jgi:hypothetical protein
VLAGWWTDELGVGGCVLLMHRVKASPKVMFLSHLQDLEAVRLPWQPQVHDAVEAAGAQEGRVQRGAQVGGTDH